jgi:hypothetical protein
VIQALPVDVVKLCHTSPARLDLTGRLPGPRAASDRLVDR